MAGVERVMSQKASEAVYFTINPKPMKYILATACSNPAATKAAIGNTVKIARWAGSRLESDSQTARQTNVLQSMPNTNARSNGNAAFASAVRSAVRPTCPAPNRVMAGQQHEQSDAERTGKIADPYQRPDA